MNTFYIYFLINYNDIYIIIVSIYCNLYKNTIVIVITYPEYVYHVLLLLLLLFFVET